MDEADTRLVGKGVWEVVFSPQRTGERKGVRRENSEEQSQSFLFKLLLIPMQNSVDDCCRDMLLACPPEIALAAHTFAFSRSLRYKSLHVFLKPATDCLQRFRCKGFFQLSVFGDCAFVAVLKKMVQSF